jgi:hypothetical protein
MRTTLANVLAAASNSEKPSGARPFRKTPTRRMMKELAEMTKEEIDLLTEEQSKEVLAQELKGYKDGLERQLAFLVSKLGEDDPPEADTAISINMMTNLMVGFGMDELAGYLAVAQYELAVRRYAERKLAGAVIAATENRSES